MKNLSLFALAATLFSVGCATDDPRFGYNTEYIGEAGVAAARSNAAFDNVSYWDGDGVSGAPSIKVRLGEQRAYFYKGGTLVGVSALSTGREGYDTTTGTFKITQKNIDHKSNLYGDYVDQDGNVIQKDIAVRKDPKPPGAKFDGAKMPYFMRIVGGIGMHEGFLPGYAASHGCIRMPEFMARNFYNNVELGTPVTVTR